MSLGVALNLTPPLLKGMKVLDRAAFVQRIPLWGLKVPAKDCSVLLKSLAGHLLSAPRTKIVIPSPVPSETSSRVLLLNYRSDQVKKEELSEPIKSLVESNAAQILEHTLEVGYDYWAVDQILHSVLPDDLVVPAAFEMIGHIAHLNLRDPQLDYKSIIGQVIMDKNPTVKTVINKVEGIDTKFRFFKMEILAGEDRTLAEVKESGCTFRFDFAQVYWNSRLHTEHERLVSLFKKGDVILDMFAGVGPFAIPAAKKGCIVHGNDLNPASFQYMKENSKLNKTEKTLKCYNLDARDFVNTATRDLATEAQKTPEQGLPRPLFHHAVMNLPASAIEFLDVFRGLFHRSGIAPHTPASQLPMVHCHCFSSNLQDPGSDIKQRVESVIRMPLAVPFTVHRVRSVSTNKDMFCVSFRLPHDLVFCREQEPVRTVTNDDAQGDDDDEGSEQRKKQRVE